MSGISPIGNMGIPQVALTLPYRLGAIDQAKQVPIPEGMQIRKRISRDFGIDTMDTDVRFNLAEVAIIEETLKEIKKRNRAHLIGVKQIVKNKEGRVRLENARHVSAGGAYVPEEKRVYLFDSTLEKDIPEVLIHEVGHAVNYFNLEFSKFMQFIRDSGYNMVEFRKFFVPGNKLHQIGAKMINVPKDGWGNLEERFSLNSLIENRDVFGEIVLKPRRKPKFPWEENPLERFAWAYEWFVMKSPEFERMADVASQKGDDTYRKGFEFIKDEVFKDEAH